MKFLISQPVSGFMTVSQKNPERAFTLTELLVVIGIIAALTGVSMVAFKNLGTGQGTTGALDIASSLTMGARLEATTLGKGSLLVIDAEYDADHPENYLRRAAIFQGVDVDGETEWVISGKAIFIPKNIYFLEDYSDGFRTDKSLEFQTFDTQTGDGPGNAVFYYEFNGSGHLVEDPQAQDTRLVFSPGTLQTDGELILTSTQLSGRKGFLLRQNGRPVFFESLDQMPDRAN